MQLSFTEKKNIRKNFGKLKEDLSIPNLIEVQKNSYKQLTEFVESMDTQQFTKIRSFFEAMPKISHDVKLNCPQCKEKGEEGEHTITLQGLASFFG